jgi:heat shock protein HspQ
MMIRAKNDPPHFEVGDLVRHRRYGYRGVVVDFDSECQAPESWYSSNRTQPLRQQPWYHVLVHGSSTATYAAQENLEPDRSGETVDHPLVELYFETLVGGRYVRNDEPWVGW